MQMERTKIIPPPQKKKLRADESHTLNVNQKCTNILVIYQSLGSISNFPHAVAYRTVERVRGKGFGKTSPVDRLV